jgi:hypothetical protein
MSFEMLGLSEFGTALSRVTAELDAGSKRAIGRGAAEVEKTAKENAAGTPGPDVVTGTLRRGVGHTPVHRVGLVGWQSEVGPTVIYSRRIDLGFHGTDSLGRVYCVDEQTEALTIQGWRKHDELQAGDLILALDPATWTMKWTPVQAVHRYGGVHNAVRFGGRTMSVLATAEHRWLTQRYYGRGKRFVSGWRTTVELTQSDRFPLSAPRGDAPPTKTHSDDLVEFVAWFWTEGSFDWSRRRQQNDKRTATTRPISLSLSQSPRANPEKCVRIEALLSRLFGLPGRFEDGAHWHGRINSHTGTCTYRIDRVAAWLVENLVRRPSKALEPAFLCSLTNEQLELLINVSLLADGYVDPMGTARLSQDDEERIRGFEMACALAGRPITTHFVPRRNRWITTLLHRPFGSPLSNAFRADRPGGTYEPLQHEGLMWCPTTELGTWLARRDGTIYVTGNSQEAKPFFTPAWEKVVHRLPGIYAEEWSKGLVG